MPTCYLQLRTTWLVKLTQNPTRSNSNAMSIKVAKDAGTQPKIIQCIFRMWETSITQKWTQIAKAYKPNIHYLWMVNKVGYGRVKL